MVSVVKTVVLLAYCAWTSDAIQTSEQKSTSQASLMRSMQGDPGSSAYYYSEDSSSHLMRSMQALVDSAGSTLMEKSEVKPNASSLASFPPSILSLGKKMFGVNADSILVWLSQAKPFKVTIEDSANVTFSLRSSPDDVVREMLPDEVRADPFGMKRLKGISSGTVIDIGSKLGTFTIGAALTNPKLQILACEPVPLTYFFLKWNLLANKIPELSESEFRSGKPGVLAMQQGVTKDGRDLQVQWSTGPGQNTNGENNLPEEVNATAHSLHLPTFLGNGTDIAFLEMDCEGCEHEVVPDMQSSGLLSHVKMGAVEINEDRGATVVQHTEDILKKHPNINFVGEEIPMSNLPAILFRSDENLSSVPVEMPE